MPLIAWRGQNAVMNKDEAIDINELCCIIKISLLRYFLFFVVLINFVDKKI